jgi:hypothetical protein
MEKTEQPFFPGERVRLVHHNPPAYGTVSRVYWGDGSEWGWWVYIYRDDDQPGRQRHYEESELERVNVVESLASLDD